MGGDIRGSLSWRAGKFMLSAGRRGPFA